MKKNICEQKDLKPGPQANLRIESNRDMAGQDALSWTLQGDKKKNQPRRKHEREAQTELTTSIKNEGTEKRKKMPKPVLATEILPHASIKEA